MTTWRDIADQLTLRQIAELAAGEGFGYAVGRDYQPITVTGNAQPW